MGHREFCVIPIRQTGRQVAGWRLKEGAGSPEREGEGFAPLLLPAEGSATNVMRCDDAIKDTVKEENTSGS